VTILVGSGHVDQHDNTQPERETERDRQNVGPEQLVLQLGEPRARRAAPRSADIVGISLSDDITPQCSADVDRASCAQPRATVSRRWTLPARRTSAYTPT
jgi:hypothetical protein